MTNEIKESLMALKEALYNDDDVKQYLALKDAISKDNYLVEIKKQLKNLHDDICHHKDDEVIHAQLLSQYKQLEKEYDENEIVIQYREFKKSVDAILKEIAGCLSN